MKQIAVITGASTGFGKLISKTLAQNGLRVFATMRNTKTSNKAVAAELSAIENISVLEMDVTNTTSIDDAINQIISKEGRLDVLINNAGISSMGIIESHTLEDVRTQFEVNTFGPFSMIKKVLPLMRKNNSGYIINISSGLGRINAPFFGVYASSKHALECMSETLRYELSHTPIDLTIVEPGVFPSTNFIQNMKVGGPSDQHIAKEYGEYFEGWPANFVQFLQQMAQSENAPNPQMVADAVMKLIQTKSGQRPLRLLVDPMKNKYFEDLNNYTDELHKNLLPIMQLGNLYR